MVKILVTGGAGFIGSALIRHIINDTDDLVVNVDKLTYAGNLESLANVSNNHRYTFEHVDICNASELNRVFNQQKPDIVMHLAAESHVDRSIDGPGEFIQTNIVGTYILLEQARDYWSKLEGDKKANFRFHHISTDEVYGDLTHPDEINIEANLLGSKSTQYQYTQSLPLFTEKNAYAPSSPYSATKAASDHLVRAWQRTYGLPILITNCSNNYGPFHFPEKLIPLTIFNALEGKPLPIYGNGNQIRDWLYVEDHARALLIVAKQGQVGETYNIGGHNEKQNIEVVKTICKILDEILPSKQIDIKDKDGQPLNSYFSLVTFVTDRSGHDMRYAIDASKIQRELGWTPKETFESGIRKTIQWCINNKTWYQNLQNNLFENV